MTAPLIAATTASDLVEHARDGVGDLDPEEPIFILRAQDKLAWPLVMLWASLAEQHGAMPDKIRKAMQVADKMQTWRPHKFPD